MLPAIEGRNVVAISAQSPEPGDFAYYTRHIDELDVVAGMVFSCPCGCGTIGTLKFGEDHNPH